MMLDIDRDDAKLTRAAADMLRRHDNGEAEANITSAIRDFLVIAGLVRQELRTWLRGSGEGLAVEDAVIELLGV